MINKGKIALVSAEAKAEAELLADVAGHLAISGVEASPASIEDNHLPDISESD